MFTGAWASHSELIRESSAVSIGRVLTRRALLVVLVASTVVACEQSPRADTGTAIPAARQDLVVAIGADESGLQLNRGRLGRYPLNAGICEPLVQMTPDFRVAPSLASRWNYLGDNTYRFTLRRDVKFHDGRPLNAASVKYTIDRGIADKTQNSFLSPTSVRIIDDSTLDIRPTIPNLRLLEQLAHPSYGIVAAGSDPSVHPDCTGAFRFTEHVARNHLSVARNDSYWGKKAKLSKITFRFIPDDNTRALALRAGEVDMVVDVNRSMVANLEATPGIKVVTSAPGAVVLIYLATHGTRPYAKMSDPAIRRAVAMAIDRKTLVNRVMDGHAAVVNTVNPPAVLGSYSSLVHGVSFDTVQANHALDADGWKRQGTGVRFRDGETLSLSLISQPGAVDHSIAEYVQAQLSKVGIAVRIDELDAAAYEGRLNSGAFDLDIEVPNQNDANPAFLLALRWYSSSNVRSSRAMWAGARFDSLVGLSLASADRDSSQRKAAEAMHVLIDEEVAAIPLAGIYRIYAMSSKVKGFEPHPSRVNQSWSDIWMAR